MAPLLAPIGWSSRYLGYGEGMTTPHVPTHYRVEYIDGPLEGQSEDRLLIGGDYDREFTTIAAVEGLESSFVYRAVDERELDGQLHVRYSFDASDSDPVQGDGDEGDSLTI